ncbi:MAG TPA: Mrp/NBP35 family ATP-binding protein [Spirochaetota bacterium]|nr:Mrp/NBP35 family ATP-binding protein [Spirochaetota bacterium]HPI89348.1 Mrp/NBP35 family ATP-binding protein [Spirochaetota bacterium]HPR48307.1 Mrp/NBP35 family ATP-binding protein [Spirochaetota bacterium]
MNDPKSSQNPPAQSKEDEQKEIKETLGRIRNKIVVLSGKGGVGKSTVAVNLAAALAAETSRVGLLDVDIHGPSVPMLLGLQGKRLEASVTGKLLPVEYSPRLKVISIGFLLEDKNSAIIWRGPLKYGVIKQFIKDVTWGDLDYLVVDSPPGTGDEPLSVCQLIEKPDGAIIVTTPQDVAVLDVRKSVNFCVQLGMPILGVIENMSGFVCPHCGKETPLFKTGGGKAMAEELGIPFLGSVPIEPAIAENADAGVPFYSSAAENATPAQKSFTAIVKKIIEGVNR